MAKRAGVDAIKYQWTSSPERLAARRHADEYIGAYRMIAFHAGWLAECQAVAQAVGLEWMCTTFLEEDIPVVAGLVKRFKISSFEASDEPFLNAHLSYRKPIIISTGGMNEDELWRLKKWWAANAEGPEEDISLLHCVSSYPTPIEELNLHIMDEMDGLSDHTANVLTGALATVRGAKIIEVHFRLDSTAPANPDYGHSLSPDQLVQYVQNVRFAETAMGSGEKRLMPSEERWAKYRVRG